MEPNEYFKNLKGQIYNIDKEFLEGSLTAIETTIINANDIGQKSLIQKLGFARDVIQKEQQLHAAGITAYCEKSDVLKFIEKVEPKNSVKIIELERYPRIIPSDNIEHIASARALDVFNAFYVVFTDFTDNDYKTEEEKKVVSRNRDPIVFGTFEDKNQALIHERLYFITDWEDEYCDLTFGKLLDKMSTMGIKKPAHKIATDANYINDIIAKTKEPTSSFISNNVISNSVDKPGKRTFFDWVRSVF